jgi:hypothetical protein
MMKLCSQCQKAGAHRLLQRGSFYFCAVSIVGKTSDIAMLRNLIIQQYTAVYTLNDTESMSSFFAKNWAPLDWDRAHHLCHKYEFKYLKYTLPLYGSSLHLRT